MAQMIKNLPAMQETLVWSLVWEGPLEKGMATHSSILAWRRAFSGFCDKSGLPASGRGSARQRCCTGKQRNSPQVLFQPRPFVNPEKAMAPHSNTLAWKIPWTEEPGGLQSMGSLRVRHDWATSLSLFTFIHWRRKWQPTPVFLPGESQGRGSLVGCRLWGHTESDTTEVT